MLSEIEKSQIAHTYKQFIIDKKREMPNYLKKLKPLQPMMREVIKEEEELYNSVAE